MNEVINKFLLGQYKFTPKLHLKQHKYSCSTLRPFTKNKERMEKLKKQEIKNVFIKMS